MLEALVSGLLAFNKQGRSGTHVVFLLPACLATVLNTPGAQGQDASSPELLLHSLMGGQSAKLLLDLEHKLCQESSTEAGVGPLLQRLQQEPQPFLLLLRTLDAPGPNKALLLRALR